MVTCFGPQVDQQDLEFAAVVAVDGAGSVDHGQPVPDGEPGARTNLTLPTRRDLQNQTRGYRSPFTGGDHHLRLNGGPQIGARRARRGVTTAARDPPSGAVFGYESWVRRSWWDHTRAIRPANCGGAQGGRADLARPQPDTGEARSTGIPPSPPPALLGYAQPTQRLTGGWSPPRNVRPPVDPNRGRPGHPDPAPSGCRV